jgi:hypothetical protein
MQQTHTKPLASSCTTPAGPQAPDVNVVHVHWEPHVTVPPQEIFFSLGLLQAHDFLAVSLTCLLAAARGMTASEQGQAGLAGPWQLPTY